MKPSARWREQAAMYLVFARGYAKLDRSEEAAREMYRYESTGKGLPDPWGNAYYVGKHWLNVTVVDWIEDLHNGRLFIEELFFDQTFPHEWLARVLRRCAATVRFRA